MVPWASAISGTVRQCGQRSVRSFFEGINRSGRRSNGPRRTRYKPLSVRPFSAMVGVVVAFAENAGVVVVDHVACAEAMFECRDLVGGEFADEDSAASAAAD